MLQASPISRSSTGPRRDEKMLKPFAETDNHQCLMRCTPMSDADRDNPRREFLRKSLTLIPVVTLAGTGLGSSVLQAAPEATPAAPAATPAKADASAYQPSYFTAEEWAFINAAVGAIDPQRRARPGRPGSRRAGIHRPPDEHPVRRRCPVVHARPVQRRRRAGDGLAEQTGAKRDLSPGHRRDGSVGKIAQR